MAARVILAVLVSVAGLLNLGAARTETWDSHAVLAADGSVRIKWRVHDGNFTCQIEADTLGWVGFGLSPNGAMKNSDMVIVGVKHDKPYIVDMHSGDEYDLQLDQRQDCHLVAGWETDGTTTVVFTRRLTPSCQPGPSPEEDRDITEDTQHVLYAYHSLDPEDVRSPGRHEHRGQRSIHLTDPAEPEPASANQDSSLVTWAVTQQDARLPNSSTVYWCRVVPAPQFSQPHHAVKYRAVITPGNEPVVHHMLMYQCSGRDFSPLGPAARQPGGYRCYSANMPPTAAHCRGIIAGWGVGGGEFTFPNDVGFPYGPSSEAQYYILEVHYDLGVLPAEKRQVVDSSGLEFTLTPHLRPQEASMLTLGSDVTPLQMVPPHGRHVVTVGHCPDECLDQALPEEGVTLFSALPHTHLLGRQIRLRHFRRGRELPPLLRDDAYDFNYQQLRHITPRRLLRGDQLTVECLYDSDRDAATLGGLSTDEEMCVVAVQYYPAMSLVKCVSSPQPSAVLDVIGLTGVTRDHSYGLEVSAPEQFRGLPLTQYVSQLDWNRRRRQQLRYVSQGPHVPECYQFGRRLVHTSRNTTEYPSGARPHGWLSRASTCEQTSTPESGAVTMATAPTATLAAFLSMALLL